MPTEERRATIRERYDEFRVGKETVSMISDPENPNAWIQSDVKEAVRP